MHKTTELKSGNFNISKSRDTTLKQNFNHNMDAAFTSAGTMSE